MNKITKFLKELFEDNRPRGFLRITVEQGGLIGRMNGNPVKELICEVRENERKGNLSNIDIIHVSGGTSLEIVKRDIYPDGSWIETNKIEQL